MFQLLSTIAASVVVLHGLIHLMGFVAYWPLAQIAELPYKTTLLGTRWAVGEAGMRWYSILWLGTAVGMIVTAVGIVTRQPWWYQLLGATALLSVVITALDWHNAFRGTIISSVILVFLMLVFWTPRLTV